ncbi:hypothetical protein ACGFX4_38540 [Kitasatospora sp. NPDC048365]|uniref:hypothetical protein n=1 Tax=Kitasatospora sp. NPDC048365 TaxID=3364050 RepID=UPI00371F84ED
MDRFDAVVPGEGAAAWAAAQLCGRGHGTVAFQPAQLVYPDPVTDVGRPVDGWWHVVSAVDDEGLATGGTFGWERLAVNSVARAVGGYGVGYGTGFPGAAALSVSAAATVRKVPAAEARSLRERTVAAFPPAPADTAPDFGLRCPHTHYPLPPLQDAACAAASDLLELGAPNPAVIERWASPSAAADDDIDVLTDLARALMGDDECDADTAFHVPFLAALALRPDVSCAHRAVVITCLTRVAAHPRQRAAKDADRLTAHRLTAHRLTTHGSADETNARRAVEAAAPELLAAWERADEPVRFALAGLAALARARALTDPIHALAGQVATGPGRSALLLAAALSNGDAAGIESAITDLVRSSRLRPWEVPNPLADPTDTAVHLLVPMLEAGVSSLLL